MTSLETYFKNSQPLDQYIEAMTENKENLLTIYNSFSLPEEDNRIEKIKSLNYSKVLVITEDWCGDAMMNVPILKYFGYPIKKAIGSAATIGFIIALCGALGFLYSGSVLNANLPLSIGFINVPAFLIFIPITTFMARLGAKTVHKIDKKKISKFFGIFLLAVSIRFFYEYIKL